MSKKIEPHYKCPECAKELNRDSLIDLIEVEGLLWCFAHGAFDKEGNKIA